MKRIVLLLLLFSNVALSQNLNLGLNAYYPFTGNANDISGNNNNPTFNNATLTADRFGTLNSAYHFNGSNNYMRIPSSPSLNPGTQISVCAWVRPTGFYQGTCHGNSILMKGNPNPSGFDTYLLRFDDAIYTNGNNCTNPTVNEINQNFYGPFPVAVTAYTPYIQTGLWYSVVYTYDGSTIKLYQNCVLKKTISSTQFNFTNGFDLFFGKLDNPSYPYWLNGDLDEVRIYNRALTQAEVDIYGACSACPSAVSITAQPASVNVCAGSNASFTVGATGASTYQWQVSTNGGTSFTNISGANSATLNLTGVTAGMNNYQYHVIVNNSCGTTVPVTSANATLTVQTAPAITTQPAAITACTGSTATLSVSATGTNLTYQWQSASSCGGTFTNIPGATSSTYNAPTTAAGVTAYRVIVSGTCSPSIASGCTTVTVNNPAFISTQPSSVAACIGTNASFTVGATGASTYQWQVSTNGGASFTDISGANSATLNLTGVTSGMNNYQYHVIVNSSCGSTVPVTSANATLTLQAAPAITTQPAALSACTGSTATQSVTATGTNLTFQWQSASSCGGTFTNIPGATSSTYNAPTTVAGITAYKVIVSGTCSPSIASGCINVTVNTATFISTQPSSVAVCIGSNASFTATATGATGYQWQVSTNGGTTFTDIPGATSPVLTLTAVTAGMNNNQYRVIVNGCPSPLSSNAAALSVQSPAGIMVQPISTTSCSSSASFTVTATGTGIAYQWQVSTDGGVTYNNIMGANSSGLTLNSLTIGTANYRYRVIVSSASCGGSVTSTEVKASVGAPPSVVLTAATGASFNPSVSGGLYTTVSPVGNYTYQWKRDGDILPNMGATSITAANGLLLCFGTYQVMVTDVATGCAGISNPVIITDIPNSRNTLFLSPNPTKDIVKISYYHSSCTDIQVRMVIVYDSKGARVMTQNLTTTGTYGAMNLDISKLVQGTYMIVLSDGTGKKIASGSVVKL